MDQTDIKFLNGVGDKRAKLLERELGIKTFGDLLYYFPFRYIDRSRTYSISEIDESTPYVQIKARVEGGQIIGDRAKKRYVVIVNDGSGMAEMVWFKGISWVQKKIEIGREYIFFGRPVIFNGRVSFVHPEMDLPVNQNRALQLGVQGVYSVTEKLRDSSMGTRFVFNLIVSLWSKIENKIEETLPNDIIKSYGLLPLKDALFNIHFPQSPELLQRAQLRLKFEELLVLQTDILMQRSVRVSRNDGFLFSKVGPRFNKFYDECLPFPLTGAQKRVIKEIRQDTVKGHQMNRLLQGDVGSGKTVVALMSMLIACDNGFQSCMMAPTEILAVQHYESISQQVAQLGVNVALLTGSTRKKERAVIDEKLRNGEIDILIGTHALIEDNVVFSNLGFVVIDEQHRFGVQQRAKLWTKNHTPPHILVMTATPIPRTLAMTIYGDLDVSVIDELPAGRKGIKTLHFFDSHRLRVFGFIRDEIKKGRQVYVVYPLIKESEKMDYKDLEDGYRSISEAFPPPEHVTVVVHGKMSSRDKDYGMKMFKDGVANIMVATSVIEVGVNVPNATVMVIESAERFGLSQLHQLRGRVGRGAEQSYCILMSGNKLSSDSRSRLEAMVSTTDGFELSELDLKLRGPGDICGTMQSGLPFDLKIASLTKDSQIMILARDCAEKIVASDPELKNSKYLKLKQKIISNKKGMDIEYRSIS